MSPSEELHWFNSTVRLHEPALRAYLQKRFPSLEDYDDLVQEAYVRLLNAQRKGRLNSTKAFLFTVTRNLAIDAFRRRQTAHLESLSEVVEEPMVEENITTVASLEHHERLKLLLEAVAALPERCREVMMLRHLDGLSYKQIAERLGISPNTVKVHIMKGLRGCTTYFLKSGLIQNLVEAESNAASEEINT